MKLFVCLIATFIFTGVATFTPLCHAGDNCDFILNTKCTMCHNLGRVCRKLGKKSKSRWRKTIKRMVKHGTPLSDDEQKELTLCLYNESDTARAACE